MISKIKSAQIFLGIAYGFGFTFLVFLSILIAKGIA